MENIKIGRSLSSSISQSRSLRHIRNIPMRKKIGKKFTRCVTQCIDRESPRLQAHTVTRESNKKKIGLCIDLCEQFFNEVTKRHHRQTWVYKKNRSTKNFNSKEKTATLQQKNPQKQEKYFGYQIINKKGCTGSSQSMAKTLRRRYGGKSGCAALRFLDLPLVQYLRQKVALWLFRYRHQTHSLEITK